MKEEDVPHDKLYSKVTVEIDVLGVRSMIWNSGKYACEYLLKRKENKEGGRVSLMGS